jgi:DNA polymerase III delta subunit
LDWLGGGIRGKIVHENIFDKIISIENLFLAWNEFKKGKRKKTDVQEFEYNLEDNIFNLHQELKDKIYQHSNYTSFYVKDPKLRLINKACVKDRVLHRAIFRILCPIFDKSFIFDSYSCRNNKGAHKAVNRLNCFAKKVSKNNTETCFVLKLDVKKFFASINQDILINLIKRKIEDGDAIWLIEKIIKSFLKGLPLGNITSQLFANVYLNELDQFVKHKLKIKYYVRYCDDFVILDQSKVNLIYKIDNFLKNHLKLSLHPDKISIRKYNQGIDFLGYVSFPYFKILRVKTRKRIIQKTKEKEKALKNGKISKEFFDQSIQSCLGILKHCDSYKIKRNIFDKFLGMIYFIYGQDSYRSKRKLEEIIKGYKTKHKSGLNLVYIDAKNSDFKDFYSNFKITSMFAEKKLIVLKNVFSNAKFQEDFLEDVKNLEELKDIVVVFEDCSSDKRTKIFKALQKYAKCQEFSFLTPINLKKWVLNEFAKNNVKINTDAMDLLVEFVKTDLWQMANEITKLSNYKKGTVIKKEDVEAFVRPNVENDIFRTIEAVASKNKKLGLSLLHKHLDNGDNSLYLLSMVAYQFRNLLVVKELQEAQNPYGLIAKKAGLHPFVVQKSFYLCNQFSLEQLKKIYRKIFQIDLDIKTGKIEAETALDLLLAEI